MTDDKKNPHAAITGGMWLQFSVFTNGRISFEYDRRRIGWLAVDRRGVLPLDYQYTSTAIVLEPSRRIANI